MIKFRWLAAVALLGTAPLVAQVEGEAPNSAGPGNPVLSPLVNEEIVPASARTVMGGSSNSIPWSWTPCHFMQPFLGSELPQTTYPIRCIGFRSNNRVDTGATIDLEIWLGYTSLDHTSVTATYASNYNVPNQSPVLVYKRKMVKLSDMDQNTDPLFFQYQLPLDTPFIWNPALKHNLIFECKVYGNSNNNASFAFYCDNESGAGTTTTRIYSSNDANATTGSLGLNYGPVLRFDIKCKVGGEIVDYGKGCPGTGGFSGTILPTANVATFGNSSSSYPFGRSNMTLMQIMDASSIKTPLSVTGLAFRQSARTAGRPGGQQTVEISIGKTTSSPTGMNTTFARNFDAGPSTLAFKGTVNLPTTTGLATNPGEFPFTFPFTKPWIFVPTSGHNLAWQMTNTSTANVIVYADFTTTSTTDTGQLYNFDATATYATTAIAGYGLITGLMTSGAGNATPVLSAAGRPVLNRSFDITLSLAKASTAAVGILGFSDKTWAAFNLPLNLAGLGAPACDLLASADVFIPVATDAAGNAKVPFAIPNTASLVGGNLFHQWFVVDPAANSLGLVFTNAAKSTIGEQ